MSLKVLMFVSLMGMTQVVNGQGFGQLLECTSFINDTKQCMTEYPVVSGVESLLILNPSSLNASMVCSNKPEYVSLITCTRGAITKCLSAEFDSIYPSAEAYAANYMYFCQNSENFDSDCLIEIGKDLAGCLFKNFSVTDLPKSTDGFNKWKDYVCRSLDVTNDCLLETNISESCRSTFEMMKEMNRISEPPVCSKVNVATDNPNVQDTNDNPNVQDTNDNPNVQETTDNPNVNVTTGNASVSVNLNNNNIILFMVCLLIGVFSHGIYFHI